MSLLDSVTGLGDLPKVLDRIATSLEEIAEALNTAVKVLDRDSEL